MTFLFKGKRTISELVTMIRQQSSIDIDSLLTALPEFAANDVLDLISQLAQVAINTPTTTVATTTTTTTISTASTSTIFNDSATKRVLDSLIEWVARKVFNSKIENHNNSNVTREADANLFEALFGCSQNIDIETATPSAAAGNSALNLQQNSAATTSSASLGRSLTTFEDESRSSAAVEYIVRREQTDERLLNLLVQAALHCTGAQSAVVRTQGLNVLGVFAQRNPYLRAAVEKVLVVRHECRFSLFSRSNVCYLISVFDFLSISV